MEGKIDSEGRLWIQRKSELLMQQCPFDSSLADVNVQRRVACGSWCPLCGEPKERISPSCMKELTTAFQYGLFLSPENCLESIENATRYTYLTICQDRTLVFDKFTDERE